jgi:fibronectin type 3 domain-containing protein
VTDSAGAHNRAYVAKLSGTTGALDTAWLPTPNDRTRALVVSGDGSTVYLGGDFTSVNNVLKTTNRIAAVSASGSGAVLTAFKSGANNGTTTAPIFDLATDGSTVYEAVAGSGGACTAVNGSTGTKIWSKHANGNLQSVRYSSGIVYCGGHFSGTASFDGLTRNKLAAVSATSPYATTAFAPTINSALGVWSLASDSSHLFVGGDFTKVAGVPAQHYAEFVDSGAQTVPSAPTLSATAGNNVVHLSWSPPNSDGGSPILRYAVYRKATGATKYSSPIAKVSKGTTYDDSTALNGTSYTYAVSAINGIGEGPLSNEVQATPQNGTSSAPGAPTGLSATPGSGSVTLNWTVPSNTGGSPITGYKIYRSTTSGAETLLASPTGTATSYTDNAATSGTVYYYKVSAQNAVGEGPMSAEASTTGTAGVPSAPTLSGTTSAGVVHLSWTVPDDNGSAITKYIVVRDGVRLAVVGPTVLSYDDSTATTGVAHVYQVRAANAVGNGSFSNKVTLTP